MNESWEDLLWRIYCDGYADGERIDRRPLSQIKPIAQGLERIRELEEALREKDSCARHCEGAAYRAEAKRLRALNAELMEAASMGDEPLPRGRAGRHIEAAMAALEERDG